MFNAFTPYLLGTTYTAAVAPALYAATNGSRIYLNSQSIATGTDPGMVAFLGIPPESAVDELFVDAGRCPVSLRVATNGGGDTTALVRPTYRLGVMAPATYTPDVSPNGPAGSYNWAASSVTWLDGGSATTDAHHSDGSDWTSIIETTIPITSKGMNLIRSTYGRGQLVLKLTAASSTGGATMTFYGCAWRG